MNLQKIQECERTKLEQLSRFQLPNTFKKVGYTLTFSAFIGLIILKTVEGEPEWMRPILRYLMIIGILIVSLSKEKVEDEMIKDLRSKSYALAFIMGVVYLVLLPVIGYFIDYLRTSDTVLKEANFFEGLLSMLFVQIVFFEVLKRNR